MKKGEVERLFRKLAGLTKWEFIERLAERGIQRHYYEKDVEEDVKYAKSC